MVQRYDSVTQGSTGSGQGIHAPELHTIDLRISIYPRHFPDLNEADGHRGLAMVIEISGNRAAD